MRVTVYFVNYTKKDYDCSAYAALGSFLAIYDGPHTTVLIPERIIRLVKCEDKE